MKCDEACVVAALAASGDAAPAELSALQAHTAVCAACRAEVAGFEALRGQLHSMREAVAPDSVYAAVRARVVSQIMVSQIEGGRRKRWVLAWSSVAAVAICGIIAVFALHRSEPTAVVRTPVAPVAIASVQDSEPLVPVPAAPHRIRRAVRRIKTHEAAEPIVVHMFTSDPDVVIYWVADAKVQSSKKEIMQ